MEPIALDLINNITLLLALALIYDVTNFRTHEKNIFKRTILGIIIGSFCLLIMMNTYSLGTGLIYDTRSVLISITGVFFGAYTTIIASLFALIYRIVIGGSGIYAGSLTIIFSAAIGIYWKHIRKILPRMHAFFEFVIFGLFTHIFVVLFQFTTPNPLEQIKQIWLPFLIAFPIATGILGIALKHQENRLNSEEILINQKLLLQSSIDSPKSMEIYTINKNMCYLTFNKFHAASMKLYYGIDIKEGMNFIDCISDAKFQSQ
ncbi:MAG: LytS/YhcK type 5TM receptor domain-containing protein, partial [Bacilli bacterium]